MQAGSVGNREAVIPLATPILMKRRRPRAQKRKKNPADL